MSYAIGHQSLFQGVSQVVANQFDEQLVVLMIGPGLAGVFRLEEVDHVGFEAEFVFIGVVDEGGLFLGQENLVAFVDAWDYEWFV
jgi:hypothetical protein